MSEDLKKKDVLERVAALATILVPAVIAAVGLIFTYQFNKQQEIRIQQNQEHQQQNQKHQVRILEMQTLEKFIPHLAGNEKTKEIALIAITTLGSPEIATQFAQLSPSKGSEIATDRIMRIASSPEQGQIPKSVGAVATTERKGWSYVGHFLDSRSEWKTRYFDIGVNVDPESLIGETIMVREETGALNVREGMPTMTGSFKPVIAALKPGSRVKILQVNQWLSSGYIWAHISY